MTITLVRHTRPNIAADICYGSSDVGLDASFESDARDLIAELRQPQQLITSPLTRCRRLADLIGGTFGVDVYIDSRVREMDFGSWEGIPWSEIPRSELDAWANDFLHGRPHGGESVAMLKKRANQALLEYADSDQHTVIVTHAGVIRLALATDDTADGWSNSVDFGGLVRY